MSTRWNWWKPLCGLVLAAGLLVGCSDDGAAPDDEEEAGSTTTTLPEACRGVDFSAPTTSIPDQCADEVFALTLGESGSDEVKELDKLRLIGFGRGICAYARALAADPSLAPTYRDLIKSNSVSWDVSEDAVEEIIESAGQLCAEDIKIVLDLRNNDSMVRVDLAIGGTGTAQVTYTLPDGTTHEEQVTPLWERSITLFEPLDVQLTATVQGEGGVTCSISVGDEKVSASDDPAMEATCSATADEIRSASR